MALHTTSKIKASTIRPYNAQIGQPPTQWAPGVISLVNETRLPVGAVKEAKNLIQTQDGVWSVRPGSTNYGAELETPIHGYCPFVAYNEDGSTTQYYAVLDNGTFKYAKDKGDWTAVTPPDEGLYNTTVMARMIQYENYVLICNGVDEFSYYNIVSGELVQFAELSPPAGLSVTASTDLTSGTATIPIYYQVTAVSLVGETTPYAAVSVDVNTDRAAWYNPTSGDVSSATLYTTLTFDVVDDAIGYNIYASDAVSGVTYFLDTAAQPTAGGTVTYVDYGIAVISDFTQAPLSNTTIAPSFSWISLSDNRLWATGDPKNPNRIYWTATLSQQYALAFSPYVGGGWLDIMPGGDQRPTWVGQFRNGQGNPMTTVLLSRPDGYGSTWHISIQSEQVGNYPVAIPTAVQSIGAFGTLAPFGVVETNQNIYFHSGGTGGIYTTGTVPTLFNILATNEASILIRPDVKAITESASGQICSIEWDRKLLFSVPYGSTTNNRIFVYYLERENWNPYAFDFGVNGFFRYTDNSGNIHLLTIPTEGDHLLEINQNFLTDNGAPIKTHLQTGLVHVAPDHMQWAYVQYAYWELGSPIGDITLSLSGTPRDEALQQIIDITVPTGSIDVSAGIGAHQLSSTLLSQTDPVIYTQTVGESIKYRAMINLLLNNWEMEISSIAPSVSYTVNQFVVVGQYVPVPAPSSWIIN